MDKGKSHTRVVALLFGAGLLCGACGVLLTCDSTSDLPTPTSAVDTIVVTPTHLEVHTGDSLQLAAWGKSPSGDSVGAPVSWTATGGTVYPDGRYIAPREPGSYTVSAAYGFQRVGVATVVVRPPDSLLAGIVLEPKNLELGGGDTATVQAYAIYTQPPRMPIYPLYRGRGGAMRPDGLFTAGNGAGRFPIIAQDSGGRFADTAWVTIDGPAAASVTTNPTTVTVPAGGVATFNTTVLDVTGAELLGRAVTWSTNAPGIATVVSTAGIVTALAPGTATITARVGNATGTATVQVTGPSASAWPHEPVGFNLVSDQSWDALTSLNWAVQFGTATIGVDPTAPFSPPGVLTIAYPPGFEGGSAPGTLTHDVPNYKSIYVGLWWKASNPWQGHPSNVNKIAFLFPASGGDMYLAFYGSPGGPYELRAITQFPGIEGPWLTPNVKNVPVALGVWHRIEWLVVYNTSVSPPNGINRVWMDGQLIGDWQNVLFPQDAGMQAFKLSPTWGGVGSTKNELDFYWYDHARVSGK